MNLTSDTSIFFPSPDFQCKRFSHMAGMAGQPTTPGRTPFISGLINPLGKDPCRDVGKWKGSQLEGNSRDFQEWDPQPPIHFP